MSEDKANALRLNPDGVAALEDFRNVLVQDGILVPSVTPGGRLKLEPAAIASNCGLASFAFRIAASKGPRELVMQSIVSAAHRQLGKGEES